MKKFFIFFFGICSWICPAQANMYLVRDIPVDVTDENATLARKKAVLEAQERGFYKLLERLTLPSDMKELPVLTTEDMLNLVQDYSVSNEKTSSVRYIADISVQFNPEAIQTFFQEYHVPYITSTADKSIIFPVYRPDINADLQLWQEDNPWLQVWKKESLNSDLIPLVVPLGDLTDMAYVSEENLKDEKNLDISPLFSRYQALNALVVQADVLASLHQVKITVRPFKNEASYIGIIHFFEPLDAPLKTVLERASRRTIPLLEEKWREQNAVRFDNPSSLVTVVPIQNLGEWIQIRKRLDQVKLIKQYIVKAVRKDQAQIEIFFAGELAPFLEALKKEELFLSPAKGDLWTLRDLKDVPVEEIESFHLPVHSSSFETEPLSLPTDLSNENTTIISEDSFIPLQENSMSHIPVMQPENYQLIPSVTQPESSEIFNTEEKILPYNNQFPSNIENNPPQQETSYE